MTDRRISSFLSRHHVLTLATADACGGVWCSQAFYAWDDERDRFVFASDSLTRHGANMLADNRVAVSVALETRIVGKIQGCQITGRAVRGDDGARRRYIRRFPYAAAVDTEIWTVEADYVKFTDNTLGFGKKLVWQRDTDSNTAL
ncbi:MAG: pyridoxamine 5'-phosphate oxidase family protein [Alistipes sp.]|nr:pyridoxamine 5'-phosphate oxidase family protein [Alistipes sp.]